jgi:hypothetical protein
MKMNLIGLAGIGFTALLMSGCAGMQPVEKRVINNPTIEGYAIDRCMTWGKDCGQPVADKICTQMGYEYASTFNWGSARPTKLLTGKICDTPRCGAITSVECVRRVSQ